MKIYNCDVCSALIYFENSECLNCQTQLGYLPLLDNMSSLEKISDGEWRALAPQAQGQYFKKCHNYQCENICNWMIETTNSEALCLSCRLTEVIPNLNFSENRDAWNRLEIAKRRLVYSLNQMGLPLKNKDDDAIKGLSFLFLSEEKSFQLKETKKVLTGHNQGQITINTAEVNDAVREKMRLDMNERYRTVLGHFRHEIGHYYWFLFLENNPDLLQQFRNLFGDEQLDYTKALKNYYSSGAPEDWPNHFVSKYASAHPWEDWAESWAHYMHMFDTLETANAWGLSVKPTSGAEDQTLHMAHQLLTFEEMKDQWVKLSSALNSINRSMGMKDIYPFVWSSEVIEKIRFIQQIILKFKKVNGL